MSVQPTRTTSFGNSTVYRFKREDLWDALNELGAGGAAIVRVAPNLGQGQEYIVEKYAYEKVGEKIYGVKSK